MRWCLFALLNSYNQLFFKGEYFPEELKRSEVIALYKKLDSLKKENYTLVSLLPHVSKIFERIIYKQINTYMEDKLSKCLTGFRKSHWTQHLLEKWKKSSWKGRMHFYIIFRSLKSLWHNQSWSFTSKIKGLQIKGLRIFIKCTKINA